MIHRRYENRRSTADCNFKRERCDKNDGHVGVRQCSGALLNANTLVIDRPETYSQRAMWASQQIRQDREATHCPFAFALDCQFRRVQGMSRQKKFLLKFMCPSSFDEIAGTTAHQGHKSYRPRLGDRLRRDARESDEFGLSAEWRESG